MEIVATQPSANDAAPDVDECLMANGRRCAWWPRIFAFCGTSSAAVASRDLAAISADARVTIYHATEVDGGGPPAWYVLGVSGSLGLSTDTARDGMGLGLPLGLTEGDRKQSVIEASAGSNPEDRPMLDVTIAFDAADTAGEIDISVTCRVTAPEMDGPFVIAIGSHRVAYRRSASSASA